MTQETVTPYATELHRVLAQVALCLRVRKESLPYDRTLGSTLYLLRQTDGTDRALCAAQQAVQRLSGVQIRQIQGTFSENGAVYTVQVDTPCGSGYVTVPFSWQEGETA